MRLVPYVAMVIVAVGIFYGCAYGAECPTPDPCKVLTLTPQEEGFLTQPGGILDTAQKGRLVDLVGPVQYFRDRIRDAPAGEPKKPDPK